ncbi:MAG: Y-family DNA polymerase [Bdellovibrionota bacterium]
MPSDPSDRLFALVDCNSFYCSCERVFNPKLRDRPVIVLSNNDGCAVARTDEAKALGIPMGAPYFKIKDIVKKHNVAVYSSNYALYGDMSRRVMQILSEYTPELEVYSIDEAFLSLKGFESWDLHKYAREIKESVYQRTGIPVSIGIAPTKVLAKAANRMAKKNKEQSGGVFDLRDPTLRDQALKKFPVEDLWGIGRKSHLKLAAYNIHTAHDLKLANEKLMQKLLTIVGRRIVEELNGISCLDLEEAKDRKQIISSRSFGRPVVHLNELRESIANHITNACEKLRSQNLIAQNINVFVQTNPFNNTPQYYNSASYTLLSGSCVTNKLIKKAFELLDQIYLPNYQYKKVGVIFNDLRPRAASQMDFFGAFDTPEELRLMQLLDGVNQREGRNTLKFAACGIEQFWKMLSKMKSAAYTTRWSEILKVV